MTKQKSTVAQCAQAIRNELKLAFPQIKFQVISDSYSGGNSVNVKWDNGPCNNDVLKIISKYQYGDFNGMTDMYEYNNTVQGIPQTKYLFTKRYITDEAKNEMLASWDYEQPKEWCRDRDKNELLYRIYQKQSFPFGAHNFKVVRTEITSGLIEDFYKIEYQEPAKPNFSPASISQSPSENHQQKIIAARFNSRCAETGTRIMKGENMLYNYDLKKCYSVNSQTYAKYTEQPDSALGMIEANEEAYFDRFCQTNNI